MDELDRGRVLDMLHYARTAVRLLGSADPAALQADERTFLAVCKAIEIVGEAADQVSAATRSRFPQVPWADAIAMRHRLVHGYRSIRTDVVVRTVQTDLPGLIASLEGALKDQAQ